MRRPCISSFSAQTATSMSRAVFILILLLAAQASADTGEESFLLHTPVAPALLDGLRIWDSLEHKWRAPRAGEAPAQKAAVLVVHIWADYCKPCRQEMPLLRDFAQRLTQEHSGRVAVIYVAETPSSLEMDRFLTEEQARMPRAPQYLDTDEKLAQIIRANRPSRELTLPVTLLLDEQRVIRQAVIGPMAASRAALFAGVAKLVHLAGRVTPRP